eukprot:CAMPEP_0174308980 /NCGR_PEP_ID=MMETSP0810-20121108/2103_1 /TAXON_ID=73025 ORGANISM="Eutreptiella gymnastica-like, Strain CCMP1594" /NCGR_SAMPLE_ID=MMETSP0810 /ASSEMBLY_ACC=CAM_ASM_000659 /LENGTH=902 /DNA_ID=CAMNT_0015416457 /DNA_START=145 /DNA_END=2853 /DNA_ORIENTATION=+
MPPQQVLVPTFSDIDFSFQGSPHSSPRHSPKNGPVAPLALDKPTPLSPKRPKSSGRLRGSGLRSPRPPRRSSPGREPVFMRQSSTVLCINGDELADKADQTALDQVMKTLYSKLPLDSKGHMSERLYKWFYEKLYFSVVESPSKKECNLLADMEWQTERKGRKTMNFTSFRESILSFVRSWCTDPTEAGYVEYIERVCMPLTKLANKLPKTKSKLSETDTNTHYLGEYTKRVAVHQQRQLSNRNVYLTECERIGVKPNTELTASLSVVDGVYDMKELRAAGLNLDQLTPLADVIVLNQGLNQIYLQNNCLTSGSITLLCTLLRAHEGIEHVNLSKNPQPSAAARVAIQKLISYNQNIVTCNVQGLGPEQWHVQIKEQLHSNTQKRMAITKKLKEAKKIFDQLDKSGTGELDKDELQDFFLSYSFKANSSVRGALEIIKSPKANSAAQAQKMAQAFINGNDCKGRQGVTFEAFLSYFYPDWTVARALVCSPTSPRNSLQTSPRNSLQQRPSAANLEVKAEPEPEPEPEPQPEPQRGLSPEQFPTLGDRAAVVRSPTVSDFGSVSSGCIQGEHLPDRSDVFTWYLDADGDCENNDKDDDNDDIPQNLDLDTFLQHWPRAPWDLDESHPTDSTSPLHPPPPPLHHTQSAPTLGNCNAPDVWSTTDDEPEADAAEAPSNEDLEGYQFPRNNPVMKGSSAETPAPARSSVDRELLVAPPPAGRRPPSSRRSSSAGSVSSGRLTPISHTPAPATAPLAQRNCQSPGLAPVIAAPSVTVANLPSSVCAPSPGPTPAAAPPPTGVPSIRNSLLDHPSPPSSSLGLQSGSLGRGPCSPTGLPRDRLSLRFRTTIASRHTAHPPTHQPSVQSQSLPYDIKSIREQGLPQKKAASIPASHPVPRPHFMFVANS